MIIMMFIGAIGSFSYSYFDIYKIGKKEVTLFCNEESKRVATNNQKMISLFKQYSLDRESFKTKSKYEQRSFFSSLVYLEKCEYGLMSPQFLRHGVFQVYIRNGMSVYVLEENITLVE